MPTTFPVWPAASTPPDDLFGRVRPYQRQWVRHQRIREAFMPRTLAGTPATSPARGYTQSNRRLAQQARLGLLAPASHMGMGMGMGALGSGSSQQLVLSAPQIAGSTATGIIGGAVKAGTLAANSAWATIGIPVIGAAVVGVTMWLSSMFKRNAQKEAATNIVDQIEIKLKENLDGYLNGPRTPESQAQALANFDAGWNAVIENCSNPELGSAGERCISERQEGGTAPWCPKPGGKGCDWFALYRYPIASDTPVQTQNVVEGSGMAVNTINEVLGGSVQFGGVVIDNRLLLGAAAIILGLAFVGGDRR